MASSTNEIYFVIDGETIPKGRPKFSTKNGVYRSYTPQKTIDYEEHVRESYRAEYPLPTMPFGKDDPLEVVTNFYFAIPKATPKSKILKFLTVLRPTKRPDLDNLYKSLTDALNGVCYPDDSQIVTAHIHKLWSESPKAEITIRRIT